MWRLVCVYVNSISLGVTRNTLELDLQMAFKLPTMATGTQTWVLSKSGHSQWLSHLSLWMFISLLLDA